MHALKVFLFVFISFLSSVSFACADLPHYYCTPSDARHFHLVKNLIGSIHQVDFEHTGQIAVFDLGLTQVQRNELLTMQKVNVYNVQMVHPDLLTYFKTHPKGRQVRGNFAWKPVIIKQALDLFPYVLYLDAGSTVLKPLDELFLHITTHGYFLLSCAQAETCKVKNRITKTVVDYFYTKLSAAEMDMILSDNSYFIDAGLQGLSRSMLQDYVMPMYHLAANIGLFSDDGTALYGYGEGRHDQTLFTIFALCLGLKINLEGYVPLNGEESATAHIHWHPDFVNRDTIIYRSRHDIRFNGGRTQFIRYK